MSDAENGTYTIDGSRITLVPQKRSKAKARPDIVATLLGNELRASYVLRMSSSSQRIALVLRRDPRYW